MHQNLVYYIALAAILDLIKLIPPLTQINENYSDFMNTWEKTFFGVLSNTEISERNQR